MLLGTDGAGSVVRDAIVAARGETASETPLAHGYKELTLPPLPNGDWRLERRALHIWPRGDFMLIALPNSDGSFTCTLFLAFEGDPSFATLEAPGALREFFAAQFPDIEPLPPRSRGGVRRAPHRHHGDGEEPGLARRRRGAASRRRGARHRPLLRAGDELRLRGLRGARRAAGRIRAAGRGVRPLRGAAEDRTPTPSPTWRWRTSWRCGPAPPTPGSCWRRPSRSGC